MRLHVVYRSYGGENHKDRPSWYSKDVALFSFCRSLDEAGGDIDVVFLNDGHIPADRVELMVRYGELVPIRGGTNRRSYLQGLKIPRARKWADNDVVLFAEDDYLWRPEALQAVTSAALERAADYLAPYGSSDLGRGDGHVRWLPHPSTTSTFAVRVGALRQDVRLLQLCCLSGGDFDHTSCLTLQGIARFRPLDIIRHHEGPEGSGPMRAAVRAVYLATMRLAADARSLRRPSRRRGLLAAEPPLATHMEVQWLAPGDWEELARQTLAWGQARVLPPPPSVDVTVTTADEPARRAGGR